MDWTTSVDAQLREHDEIPRREPAGVISKGLGMFGKAMLLHFLQAQIHLRCRSPREIAGTREYQQCQGRRNTDLEG
eukprot:9332883-Prorocentrum_lima.AAC.1